jgi:hypothetical protein
VVSASGQVTATAIMAIPLVLIIQGSPDLSPKSGHLAPNFATVSNKGETELLVGLVEHVTFHNAGKGVDAVSSKIRSRPISFLSPSGKRLARSVYASWSIVTRRPGL